MAEASASVTPLSSVFPTGSGIPAESSDEPEKKKEKPDKVPAPASDDTKPSPKKKEGEEKAEKDTPADDKSVRQKLDKDEKADKGEKKDKPVEKPAEKADESEDSKQDSSYEKRFKDTQAWANKINQEKLQLQHEHQQLATQVDMLQKKLADPEYDPTIDPKYAGPTKEEIAETSVYAGKALASRDAAMREFGQDKVLEELDRFGNMFKGNKAIQSIVRESNSPVHEAMLIMERVDFEKKYGDRPTKIHAAIKAEVEADMRKSIRKELIEELREGKKLSEDAVKGLSNSRSGNDTDASKSKGEAGPTPLSVIFGNNR